MGMGATSTEVKARWNKENYKVYHTYLRVDSDQDIINFIESNKDSYGTTNMFRDGIALLMEQEKGSK